MRSEPDAFWVRDTMKVRPSPSARGARTRRRIAEATLSLLEEGESPPTSRDIAQRAGVSLRLIFHHFQDLDALHDTVGTLYADLFRQLAIDVRDDLPLTARIERTVRLRAKFFESIGNLGRNVTVLAPHNPGMAARLAATQEMMLRSLESTFAPELRVAGAGGKELVAVLDIATSWSTWDRMRTVNHLSPASSRRVMAQMLHAALGRQPVGEIMALTSPSPVRRRPLPTPSPRVGEGEQWTERPLALTEQRVVSGSNA